MFNFYYLIVIIIPCSSHSRQSKLVSSGSRRRSLGSLNPPSSSLKMMDSRVRGNDIKEGGNDIKGNSIIFRARGSLICNIFINSSCDAVLIFII